MSATIRGAPFLSIILKIRHIIKIVQKRGKEFVPRLSYIKQAYGTLFPLIYNQLLYIAEMRMNHEAPDHTYSRTDLVHEAYLNLIDIEGVDWQDRNHFFSIVSRCMRQILIDHARKKTAEKRGDKQKPKIYLDQVMKVEQQAEDLIKLDESLKELAKFNQRWVNIVECRYFGEMTINDTADALYVSPKTVKRDWAKARGWLYKNINKSD